MQAAGTAPAADEDEDDDLIKALEQKRSNITKQLQTGATAAEPDADEDDEVIQAIEKKRSMNSGR